MDVRLATAEQLASFCQQDLDRATAELHLDTVSGDVIAAARTDFSDLPAVPAAVRGMVLRLAAELYFSPDGRPKTSIAIDDYRANWAAPPAGRTPGELTAAEERKLRARYGPGQHHSARLVKTCP